MLKRIATAIAALTVASPALAAPTGLDRDHLFLWSTLERHGVGVYVNPQQVCNNPKRDVDGIYFYNPNFDKAVLAVCQDNRTGEDRVEVKWTANDLDTLRHEAMHYLQDCIDGEVSMSLDPFYDGEGWAPGTDTYEDTIKVLGYERAYQIAVLYGEKFGADALTIQLEHEAFAVADNVNAGVIGANINAYCTPR